jgi:hypothetical protein
MNVFVKGNWTNNGGTFTPSTSTVTFNGTAAQAIQGTSAAQTFYNLTANLTTGQLLSVGGSTTALTITNNLIETTGNFTAPANLLVNGSVTLSAGTFTAGNSILVLGNWTNNGTTVVPGSGTVTFAGTTAQTISGLVTQSFNHVTLAMTAGQTLTATAVTTSLTVNNLTLTTGNFAAPINLTVSGNVSIAASQTLTALASSTINVGGNWTNNGTFTQSTGTLKFNGAGTQTFAGTVTSPVFYNLTVAKTVGTLLDAGTLTALSMNNYTQTTGNFTAPPTLTISGSVILTAGTLTAGTTTNFSGTPWTNNGASFLAGAGTLNFTGTAAQVLNGSVTQSFNNITVGMTAGFTLNATAVTASLTVNNLTLTTGNFSSANAAVLNINGNLSVAASSTFTPANMLNISGNFANSGTFVQGTNTVNFNGTGAQAITGVLTPTFYNVIVAKTAGQTLTASGLTSVTLNN